MTPLEESIGYKFRNSLLLAEALTHPSVGHEAQRYHFDYQRLEFLGDAVLQLVITEYLFSNFRIEAEGQLTKLRSRLVSREALRMHGATLDLGRYILMGRGEEASGGRERTSTLADAFEALIGALYLDGESRWTLILKAIFRSCCKAFRLIVRSMNWFRKAGRNMKGCLPVRLFGRELFLARGMVAAKNRRRPRLRLKR